MLIESNAQAVEWSFWQLERIERAGAKRRTVTVEIEHGDRHFTMWQRRVDRPEMNQRIPAIGGGPSGDVDEMERPAGIADYCAGQAFGHEGRHVLQSKTGAHRWKGRRDPTIDWMEISRKIVGAKLQQIGTEAGEECPAGRDESASEFRAG